MATILRGIMAAMMVVLAVVAGGFLLDQAAAQGGAQRIEKVANKRLEGASYARLSRLSWEECVQRCLADGRCMAIEHFRGGGVVFGRNAQCKLFSAVGDVRDSGQADIGYKRPGAGTRPVAPPVATPKDDGRRAADVKKAEDERRAAETQRREYRAPPTGGSPPPPPVATLPPPTKAPGSPPAPAPSAKPSEPPSRPRSILKPEDKGPAAVQADYHVVPVFYGTDRNRRDTPGKRIGYGADRAGRLEIGHALVTVPKLHQVPNIERPSQYTIPFTSIVIYQEKEDPARHFTIQDLSAMSREELLVKIRARLGASSNYRRQALVLVHGYNNGFDDALYRTAQISYDLNFDGASFLYSWPSGSGVAKYLYDRDSAQQAEPHLAEFLQMVLRESGADTVNIIAHSMGNQLLLPVLRHLKDRHPGITSKINQIILAAPDVDRTAFAYLTGEIKGVGQVTMYASANDVALQVARRAAGGVPRAGEVLDGLGPTIVAGVDTVDVSALGTDYLATNHSTYAERTPLLRDIQLILRTGQRPPELRFPLLKRITSPLGVYWKYGE